LQMDSAAPAMKRPSDATLPDTKKQCTDLPTHLWLIDPLSRVHCLDASIILGAAPQSFFARMVRHPGRMSREEPVFMSMAPWFLEAVTAWAQTYGPATICFPGHKAADVGCILEKLSYTSQRDGDLPIDREYIPPTKQHLTLMKIIDLIPKLSSYTVFIDVKKKLECNIASKQSFPLLSTQDIDKIRIADMKQAMAAMQGDCAKPTQFTLAEYRGSISVSIVQQRLRGATVTKDPVDHLVIETTPT